MIYINCLMIATTIVIIVDLSGFVDNLKGWFSGWLTKGKIKNSKYSLKPFDCSFCLNWWVCLVYLIISNSVSFFTIPYILILSLFTPVIKNALIFIQGVGVKLFDWLIEVFNI